MIERQNRHLLPEEKAYNDMLRKIHNATRIDEVLNTSYIPWLKLAAKEAGLLEEYGQVMHAMWDAQCKAMS